LYFPGFKTISASNPGEHVNAKGLYLLDGLRHVPGVQSASEDEWPGPYGVPQPASQIEVSGLAWIKLGRVLELNSPLAAGIV